MAKNKRFRTDEARIRDGRYNALRSNLDFLAHNYPRVKVLYPLMDKTIYQDFETLISGALEDSDPINDNDE